MRSIYQPTRVVNQIDRIRGDNKPCRGINENAAKNAGSRGNTKQTEKARKERHRKYAIICDLIKNTDGPVTSNMAAAAVGVKPSRIHEFMSDYGDCPFRLGATVETDGGGYMPRRLVIKANK